MVEDVSQRAKLIVISTQMLLFFYCNSWLTQIRPQKTRPQSMEAAFESVFVYIVLGDHNYFYAKAAKSCLNNL